MSWSVDDVTFARNGYRFYYSFRTHLALSVFHMPRVMPNIKLFDKTFIFNVFFKSFIIPNKLRKMFIVL